MKDTTKEKVNKVKNCYKNFRVEAEVVMLKGENQTGNRVRAKEERARQAERKERGRTMFRNQIKSNQIKLKKINQLDFD